MEILETKTPNKVWKRLSFNLHPDKNIDCPKYAEEKYKYQREKLDCNNKSDESDFHLNWRQRREKELDDFYKNEISYQQRIKLILDNFSGISEDKIQKDLLNTIEDYNNKQIDLQDRTDGAYQQSDEAEEERQNNNGGKRTTTKRKNNRKKNIKKSNKSKKMRKKTKTIYKSKKTRVQTKKTKK